MDRQSIKWPRQPTPALPLRHPLAEAAGGLGLSQPPPFPISNFGEANELPGAVDQRENEKEILKVPTSAEQERTVTKTSPTVATAAANDNEVEKKESKKRSKKRRTPTVFDT